MRIKFPPHLQNMSVIRKTEVAIVSDDNMLMDGDTHYLTCKHKLPCYGKIFGGWFRIPRWMVVGKNKGSGFVSDSRVDDFPRVDTAGG